MRNQFNLQPVTVRSRMAMSSWAAIGINMKFDQSETNVVQSFAFFNLYFFKFFFSFLVFRFSLISRKKQEEKQIFMQEVQPLSMIHISMLVAKLSLFCNNEPNDGFDFRQESNEILNLCLYDFVLNVFE